MNTEHNHDELDRAARRLDLLADRALFGLEAGEDRELAGLLDGAGGDREEFERLAAAAALALNASATDMPATLRTRLHDDAKAFASGRLPSGPRSAREWSLPMGRGGLVLLGTVAAAACVLIMVGGPRRDGDAVSRPDADIVQVPPPPASPAPAPETVVQPPRQATPSLQRDEMLASVRDAQTIDCVAAGGEDEETSAGDVVWSDQRRRGFLRVRGLARTEPGRSQYRIWILDGSRGKPISGGVFEVGGDAGEVVVPILPQAPVQGPTMFVVTAEEPGVDDGYSADRARVVARAN